jgi:starch-binding outer membrane protein, SusD/RagB family
MKKDNIIYIVIVLLLITACNDEFLERYPLSSLSPEVYFGSETELKAYTNGFYNALPAALDIFYNSPSYADEWAGTTVPDEYRGVRIVPTTGGGWTWTELRRINFFLENSYKCPVASARLKYNGLARFFRAYFYFDKVQRFGDVPWFSKVLEMDDEGLAKARDSRIVVIDSILQDLDYAIANLSTTKSAQEITKWTALAFKSRVCLFEGTFRKYNGISGWQDLLDKCASAADNMITNSGYGIYTSTIDKAYWELFIPDDPLTKEMILARQYSSAIPFVHSVNYYTLSVSYGKPGVNRHIINHYLKSDGTRFTDDPNYKTVQYFEEVQNRDPRLSQTIRVPGYKRIGETKTVVPDFASSITGYQFIKYIQPPAFDQNNCVNDMPIFRYAEVLLNFAEAKAELGTLTQTDIDKSIKLLRDRVGMPNLNFVNANATPDPYLSSLYLNVSGANKGVILEVRRERTVELIHEGFRWRDLLRWKEGQILARVFNGMYFPGVGTFDLDHDGIIDLQIYSGTKPTSVPGRQYMKIGELVLENGASGGQIITNPTVQKIWTENKDYLYPIPTQERLLNRNLTQNPNWLDDIGK